MYNVGIVGGRADHVAGGRGISGQGGGVCGGCDHHGEGGCCAGGERAESQEVNEMKSRRKNVR